MSEQPEKPAIEKPRIIVDDDWKTRVQAEKEALKQQQSKQASPPPDPNRQPDADSQSLPPASFALLVTTLATQALTSLGQVPDPVENKPVVQLELARHYIDTLAVLQEKSQGNLTRDEADMLEHVLHDLRMMFVTVQTRQHTSSGG